MDLNANGIYEDVKLHGDAKSSIDMKPLGTTSKVENKKSEDKALPPVSISELVNFLQLLSHSVSLLVH